jgi:hypothetical protein
MLHNYYTTTYNILLLHTQRFILVHLRVNGGANRDCPGNLVMIVWKRGLNPKRKPQDTRHSKACSLLSPQAQCLTPPRLGESTYSSYEGWLASSFQPVPLREDRRKRLILYLLADIYQPQIAAWAARRARPKARAFPPLPPKAAHQYLHRGSATRSEAQLQHQLLVQPGASPLRLTVTRVKTYPIIDRFYFFIFFTMWHNIIMLYLPIAIVALALTLAIREFDKWENKR